jgi:hypothetical protein
MARDFKTSKSSKLTVWSSPTTANQFPDGCIETLVTTGG